jgi:hypothetical protein
MKFTPAQLLENVKLPGDITLGEARGYILHAWREWQKAHGEIEVIRFLAWPYIEAPDDMTLGEFHKTYAGVYVSIGDEKPEGVE